MQAKENLWQCILLQEGMLKQKARDRHLNLGDNNSKYFNTMLQANKRKSTILSIQNSAGVVFSDRQSIGQTLADHFMGVLTPLSQSSSTSQSLSHLKTSGKLTDAEAALIGKPVTKAEVDRECKSS